MNEQLPAHARQHRHQILEHGGISAYCCDCRDPVYFGWRVMATRRYLTARDMHAMLERQAGVCASPECMSEGPFEADHSTPHAWDDKKPDQLLCVPCHKAKTKRDIKNIAKVRRIRNGRTQYDKRAERGSKLQSRGFIQWRGLDGTIRGKK